MFTVPLPVDDLPTLRRRRSVKWSTHPDDVLPLPVAEMDFGLAPSIQQALADAVARSDTGYGVGPGALTDALVGFARDRLGWTIDPASVTAVTDVGVAAVEVLRLLCRPGDEVVINPPVYSPFFDWLPEAGVRILEVPLQHNETGWCLDLDALADVFARRRPAAFLLCNPQNPVGRVHSAEELAEVVRLAHDHGVRVVADEIHAPLVLPGARMTPFLTVPGAAEIGVSLVSASKAWNLAGLKCASVVTASDEMGKVLRGLPADTRWRIGHFGVLAAIAAFTDGRDWLDALVATLDLRRRQLGDLLAERLPQVSWTAPEATFLAWLDCRAIGSGSEPCERFLERGRVALEPGPKFGPPGSGWVRLNFATSEEILDEAVTRMAAALT
ncbi:MAG: MalY/PatB family protein [Nocardioidaceae bacterium]